MSSSRRTEGWGLGLEDYNDEILMEILVRLPLKPIFRFKCVSKGWYRLISDPFFRMNVVNRNRITSFLGFIECPPSYIYGYSWRFITIPPQSQSQSPSAEERVIINRMKSLFDDMSDTLDSFYFNRSSSNGLFLCYRRFLRSEANKPPNFYILNPLSKIRFQLPLSPKQQQAFNQRLRLPVSSEEEPYCKPSIGLVASDKYDTYKVVRVETRYGRVEIETFSSDTGEWEFSATASVSIQIHNSLFKLQEKPHEATVIKGVIHWMRWDSFHWIITYDPYSSSSSSVGHGLNTIPLPTNLSSCKHVCLGESTDGLLQLVLLNTVPLVYIDVWTFRSINGCEEWSFRYRMPPLPHQYTPRTLLGFHPHDPSTLFLEIKGCMFVYHLRDTTATETPTTQVIMEPFLQLPHGETTIYSPIHIILQPYTLPPWYISPVPLKFQTELLA